MPTACQTYPVFEVARSSLRNKLGSRVNGPFWDVRRLDPPLSIPPPPPPPRTSQVKRLPAGWPSTRIAGHSRYINILTLPRGLREQNKKTYTSRFRDE